MRRSPAPCAAGREPSARCSPAGARPCASPSPKPKTGVPMPTDTDLIETFAPLREVEPTPAEIARVLAAADQLRAGGRDPILGPLRRRPARVVALVAATAALIGALAALPGGEADRPQNAHGILQAAAAVAAQQPGPAAYRYTRALDRFVYVVNAPDGQSGR